MNARSDNDEGAVGGTDIEVSVALLDVVEDYGRLPVEAEFDAVDASLRDTIERIRQSADELGVTPEELLLDLKRLSSLSQGIPDAEDIEEWAGANSARTYETVFGSVENAVELAVAADAGELRISVNGQYRGESGDA